MSGAHAPPAPAVGCEPAERAVEHFDQHRPEFIDWLNGLCRVAGVSSQWPSSTDMRISAGLVASLADQAGLDHATIHDVPGAHPFVTADAMADPDAPTVLLYSHHDVQPFGDLTQWTTPPTEPTIRGGRLYARGAVDDKGGIAAQLAAIASLQAVSCRPPCNVRLLVDGEEEIGSPHLDGFIDAHRELLAADVVVVLDTPNPAVGAPGLTCGLRGNTIVDVEVRCLTSPLHSGRGGGLVPDPIQVLCTLIHRLDGNGSQLAVPGLRVRDARVGLGDFEHVPFDAARFRGEVGLLDGVSFAGDPRVSPLDRLWARPALTVIAFEAPQVAQAANQVVPVARARLSMRTVPGMESEQAGETLVRALVSDPPCGADVRASVVRTVPWWNTDPSGATQRLALEALERGYGRPATPIAAGGSIGFMPAISRALPDAPCLLLGLEDPDCRAHAPDESVDLDDWAHAARSIIHLMYRLAAVPPRTRRSDG